MADEVVLGARLIDTEHGKTIARAATAALDTHFTVARQILGLLMGDEIEIAERQGTSSGQVAMSSHEAMDALLSDQAYAARKTRTRTAYSAERGNISQERLAALAPAQVKILKTLVSSTHPLDVVELTQHCGLQKKTVTNALSLLKARRLIGTHDKKQ